MNAKHYDVVVGVVVRVRVLVITCTCCIYYIAHALLQHLRTVIKTHHMYISIKLVTPKTIASTIMQSINATDGPTTVHSMYNGRKVQVQVALFSPHDPSSQKLVCLQFSITFEIYMNSFPIYWFVNSCKKFCFL